MERLAVVVILLTVIGAMAAWYRGRRAADAKAGVEGLPSLPGELRDGSVPTWVIFTTPLCVSCGAVESDLRTAFPEHRIMKVDATERADLADRYNVRRAPTVVFAPSGREVVDRLVGPESVRAHLSSRV